MTGVGGGPGDKQPDDVAAALVALASLPGVGPATVLQCHREEGAPGAWRSITAGRPATVRSVAALLVRHPEHEAPLVAAARSIDPAAELARHRADGRQVLVLGAPGYPTRLVDDPAPPAVLFTSGPLEGLDGPTIGIVGTRNATRAGRELARSLGEDLGAAGVGVVSGLALGIDGAAHEGALRAVERRGAGRPVGVIATGLDVVYPRRHADLHRNVARAGVLLSETPLGERPTTWRFPARNRIIAGLADAVVVVESRAKGGSILTAGEALDRGVTVLAVPGHPSSPSAAGTNDLLFDGATIARGVSDVLGAIGLAVETVVAGPAPVEAALSPAQRTVLGVLDEQPLALAELVARSGLALAAVSEALVLLEGQGRVVSAGGWFERTHLRRGRSAPGAER